MTLSLEGSASLRRRMAGDLIATERRGEIERTGESTFRVPSRSRTGHKHTVDVEKTGCTCPDRQINKRVCAHLWAAVYVLGEEAKAEAAEAASRPVATEVLVAKVVHVYQSKSSFQTRTWGVDDGEYTHELYMTGASPTGYVRVTTDSFTGNSCRKNIRPDAWLSDYPLHRVIEERGDVGYGTRYGNEVAV